MNAVREWTAAICMAALAAALLEGLSPDGAMQHMLRLIIGGFIVCAMVVPIGRLVPDLALALKSPPQEAINADLEGAVHNQMEDAAQQSIRNLVSAELAGLGLKCEKVTVLMDTGEDNSIGITKVEVMLPSGYEAECGSAAAHLEKVLGLKTEVTAHGGG